MNFPNAAYMIAVAATINANAASQFCAPNAAKAAQALANVNGSVSENVLSSKTEDGKNYQVILTEENLGQDIYQVSTTGGHDCLATSVKTVGTPTLRP